MNPFLHPHCRFTVSINNSSNKNGIAGIDAFLDIIDITSHDVCGYKFILHLVDPSHRYGHAVPMKTCIEEDCINATIHLLSTDQTPPKVIFYNDSTRFVLQISQKYPFISFICRDYDQVIIDDHNMYLEMVQKWISDNRRNFLVGASVVQAVMNTMPREK